MLCVIPTELIRFNLNGLGNYGIGKWVGKLMNKATSFI